MQCTDRVHAIVVLQNNAGRVLGSNLVYSEWEFLLQRDNHNRAVLWIEQTAIHVGMWWVGCVVSFC